MKIIWTEPAVDDLEAIHNYIEKDSEIYAISFIEKIFDAIDKLADFPKIGRKVPEANNPDVREILFQNYRIIYRIHHDSIQIIAVIHGSRDINKWRQKPWEII